MSGSMVNLDPETDRSHLLGAYRSNALQEGPNRSTERGKPMQTARINIEKLSIPVLRKTRDESTRMNASINARLTAKRPNNHLLKSIAFDVKPAARQECEELSMGSLGSVEKLGSHEDEIQDVN
jgi:hypothetical protein